MSDKKMQTKPYGIEDRKVKIEKINYPKVKIRELLNPYIYRCFRKVL